MTERETKATQENQRLRTEVLKIPRDPMASQQKTLKSEKDEVLQAHKIQMAKLKNTSAKLKAELADIGPKALQAD